VAVVEAAKVDAVLLAAAGAAFVALPLPPVAAAELVESFDFAVAAGLVARVPLALAVPADRGPAWAVDEPPDVDPPEEADEPDELPVASADATP
jgi:hypothetical protein